MPLPPLDPLEIHAGMVFGERRTPPPPAPAAKSSDVRAVLEEVLVPALRRTPCLVAFSGGRDSSAVVAAATWVARKHGLDDPIPVTMRYAQHPRTQESEWQELVVEHLGLSRWELLEIGDEFDVAGALAATALRRHGVFWPPNAHTMQPLLAAAQGGTLMTGNGGDELTTPWGWRRVERFKRAQLKPRKGELKHLVVESLPYPVRFASWRVRRPVRLAWLRPQAQRQVDLLTARKLAHKDASWQDTLAWLQRSRYLEVARAIFHALADDAGTQLIEPFFDPRVVAAVAASAPRDGFLSRSAALRQMFGDLLPEETITRSTKAVFTEILWGEQARAFARGWHGGGVDPRLVDPEALRSMWLSPRPDFRSATALQAAWLAQDRQA